MIEIRELKCPVCGRGFVPAPQHSYREKSDSRGRFVCSYKCVLKSEEIHEEGKRRRKLQAQKAKEERMKEKGGKKKNEKKGK